METSGRVISVTGVLSQDLSRQLVAKVGARMENYFSATLHARTYYKGNQEKSNTQPRSQGPSSSLPLGTRLTNAAAGDGWPKGETLAFTCVQI